LVWFECILYDHWLVQYSNWKYLMRGQIITIIIKNQNLHSINLVFIFNLRLIHLFSFCLCHFEKYFIILHGSSSNGIFVFLLLNLHFPFLSFLFFLILCHLFFVFTHFVSKVLFSSIFSISMILKWIALILCILLAYRFLIYPHFQKNIKFFRMLDLLEDPWF